MVSFNECMQTISGDLIIGLVIAVALESLFIFCLLWVISHLLTKKNSNNGTATPSQ